MKRLISLLLVTAMLFSVLPASAITVTDLIQKADAYINDKEYEKAHACYQLAMALDPIAEQGYLGAANLYLLMDDYQNAYLMVDELLTRNPVSAEAWLMKCRIDIYSGNVSSFETDEIFAEVCDVSLEKEYAAIGQMYMASGYYSAAAEYLVWLVWRP